MVTLLGLLCLAPALTLRPAGPGFEVLAGAERLATVAYHAAAGDQVIDSRAIRSEGGDLMAELSLPAASLTGRLTELARGVRTDWTLQAPEAGWGGGFRHAFAKTADSGASKPVTAWVTPTGAHPWEVPGDTPYPDTECQVRVLRYGAQALVMVSSLYDPDWYLGRRMDRIQMARFAPPKDGTPGRLALTWLWVPAAETEPLDAAAAERFAAEAAGRPVALTVETGRPGNCFTPHEPVPVRLVISNPSDAPVRATLSVSVRDYQDTELLDESWPLDLAPREQRVETRTVTTLRQGVLFVAAGAGWPGGRTDTRATIGVLPERDLAAVDPDSPFGMAALIAAPDRYPDHRTPEEVLTAMARIGVRWVRSGFYRLAAAPTADDRAASAARIAQLARYGILPHVQFGQTLPPDAETFQRDLTATLDRFADLAPNLEVGNELNHGGVTAPDYVDRLLRPVATAMRQAAPDTQIFSMGLGGVNKPWLDAFEAAGGFELIDVLSVHPGCHPRAPEFWEGWRGWVFRSQMQDAMAAAQRAGKRVWITEAYDPTPPGRSGLDVRTSADYLVRTYLCSLALGVEVIEWYQFQDGVWFAQRNRPDDTEYSFGIVYPDLTPKPAYVAYGTMTAQLAGARYVGRLDLGADDLYGLRFERDGEPVDILWSYREKHETDLGWWPPEKFADRSRKPLEPWVERWSEPVIVTLPAPGPVTITDLMGNEEPAGGPEVALALTGSPQYLHGLGDIPLRAEFWEPLAD